MRPRSPGAMLAPGYEAIEHLARSNRLDVYDAWDHTRECRCIVKTLRPDLRTHAGARTALLREGKLLRRLAHPNIVRGYETLREPHPAIVMETLGGETVAHLIDRRERPLAAVELAFLGLHLTSAIRYLHREGILHLDLKPSNVIAENGRAKVIDLSLARRPGRIKAGVGTWCYLAPEQAQPGEVGPAADAWGIGVTLYEAAAGDTPFGDDSAEYPQLEMRAPPLASERPRLPRALTELVDACLEPDPTRRPSLPDMAVALTQLAGSRG